VLQALVGQLEFVDGLHDGLPTQAAWRRFARAQLAPAFARVGWQAGAGEAGGTPPLRSDLVQALGRFDDEAVVAEARRRFQASLADPAAMQGDLREAVLDVVARHADAATWDALHAQALAAPSALDKSDLYESLGKARDPALAERALALMVSGEPPVTVANTLLHGLGDGHADAALAFVDAHWDRVDALFGGGGGAKVATLFFNNVSDRATLARLEVFVARHVPPETRAGVVRTSAQIRYRAGLREQRVPEADRWVANAAVM
jgi:aminopeptidase N